MRIEVFDPLNGSPEFWEAYFSVTEEIREEILPGEPNLPREKRKLALRSEASEPYYRNIHFLAFSEGGAEAAGYARLTVETPASPSYEGNKHLATIVVSVAKAHRRKGLGSALFTRALSAGREASPALSEVRSHATLDSGCLFLEKLGAKLSLESAENRLQLDRVDWEMVEGWAEEGGRKNPGTKVVTAFTIPDENIADFGRAYAEICDQEPAGDLKLRNEFPPEKIRAAELKLAERGMTEITMYSKEADGRVSGLTEIFYQEEAGHKVSQGLTGVRLAYRGRGLGKLLKARMLLHIRKNYPRVKYIATGNADCNAPMLAINRRLGFSRHLSVKIYKLEL